MSGKKSSSGVTKFCSILNYLRNEDEVLHNIIVDLCVSHLLKPKSHGITFLRPDPAGCSALKKMAADDPEEAVRMIHSMVILDHINNCNDFDDDVSTVAGVLNVDAAKTSSGSVVLKNGTRLVLDKTFVARNSHMDETGKFSQPNLAVYIANGPIDVNTEKKSKSSEERKAKKGGAEITGKSRADVFEMVVNELKNGNHDPAMELLAGIANYLKKEKHANYTKVCSQFSKDTLTSLAIVLRPYDDKNQNLYIDSATWTAVSNALSFKSNLFANLKKPCADYTRHMNSCEYKYDGKQDQTKIVDMSSKATILKKLTEFYGGKKDLGRGGCKNMLCEAELRIIMAILKNNNTDRDELLEWYKKCNLQNPYFCDKSDDVKNMPIGVYYSIIMGILRSDALLYMPGAKFDGKIDDIASDKMIKHDKEFELYEDTRNDLLTSFEDD